MTRAAVAASVLLSSAVLAQPTWTQLGVAENETYFVDFGTAIDSGDSRYVWTLLDYRTPMSTGFRSMRVYVELNCAKKQSRMRTVVAYESQMGVGRAKKIESKANPEWDFVPPGVAGDKLMMRVCEMQNVEREPR